MGSLTCSNPTRTPDLGWQMSMKIETPVLDFQLPKPPAPSDAIALGCAARFNLSPVNTPGLMHDRRFQGLLAAGQSLSSGDFVKRA